MSVSSPFASKIKIFLDGADKASMLEMNANPLVKGFTTNPSLMRKAGVRDYPAYCKEMLAQIKDKPISFEVFADDFASMKKQAEEINSWGPNVYVKIPVMNTESRSALELVKDLSHRKVKLNVTAIFTLQQVWDTCQVLRGGAPSIVSVFAGRIGDTGRDPIPLIQSSAEMCAAAGENVELLWASTREALNIVQAEQSGCKIITAPADMIKKVAGFNKDLFQMSLETIKTFKTDSEAAGFSL